MSHQSPSRLTLAQLLTLPIFAAVAMACVAAAARSGAVRAYGIAQVVLVEAIVIPLAMALVAQVIIRRERDRDRLVAALLVASSLAAIVAMAAMGALCLWDIGRAVAMGRGVPVDLLAFAMAMAGGLIGLVAATRSLAPRVVPVRCLSCGRRAMFPGRDASSDPGRSPGTPFVCDACGASARRRPGGDLDLKDDRRDEAGTRHTATIARAAH